MRIQSSDNLLQYLRGEMSPVVAPRSALGSQQFSVAQAGVDIASILKSGGTEQEKIAALRQHAALTVADYYTGGLASIAFSWAQDHWGGTLNKITGFIAKCDPIVQLGARLFGSDKWQTEGKRLGALLKQGVNIPESLLGAMHLTRGRSLEELVDRSVPQDFIGYTANGTWVNNQFAATRDERYLKPEDIWGSAACFERFGDDWLGKFSEKQRHDICEKALELGLVREHRGTIDIDWGRMPQ
ncbi:MAG: hypothetical protein EBZ48_12190 [Proteobacteria bacterium]|nr:hypothetical protein [Pseudomonadota bacterium]